MQIPKNSRKQKRYEKHCAYPECNRIFFGISISKYCHEHRKEEYRIRNRGDKGDPTKDNQIIEHSNIKVQEITTCCSLEGCNTTFTIKLFPRQKVYAKFCKEHRNEFQRERFLKSQERSA